MLKVENVETYGWEAAIRGMRNPMNSWEKSDSIFGIEFNPEWDTYPEGCNICGEPVVFDEPTNPLTRSLIAPTMKIGPNDEKLMLDLCKGGPVHAKFRRMLTITMDITAPLYWWKEFDTYKVGTVANSCSTMHKIAAKPFELDDFSREHLFGEENPDNNDNAMLRATLDSEDYEDGLLYPLDILGETIEMLNKCRTSYNATKDKRYWWQLIQLLPSSYNQRRTVQLNYEVAHNIYISRKDHKLDEWHTLCDELAQLPMSELITGEEK